MRARLLRGAFAALWLVASAAAATAAPKVVSINLCTDQLVLALADPDQILGLSPFARDRQRSWMASEASRFPRLSGMAEDVLALKPDLVLSGTYTKRATRELLKRQGLKVAEFSPPRSIAETQRQIRDIGALLQKPERADAMVRAIDRAVAEARAAAGRSTLTVLPLFRRGWVSGRDTLIGSLVDTLGLRLAGSATTRPFGGMVTLEEIIALHPDRLLVTASDEPAMDQGTAFLHHPTLAERYPPEKRIVLPETLTVCGGPMIVEALARMARALGHGR